MESACDATGLQADTPESHRIARTIKGLRDNLDRVLLNKGGTREAILCLFSIHQSVKREEKKKTLIPLLWDLWKTGISVHNHHNSLNKLIPNKVTNRPHSK